MLISCLQQHCITCTDVKIYSFNDLLQGVCVNSNSLNLLLFVMNNINGSAYIGTVMNQLLLLQRSIRTFSALILTGE